jgi:hypothetical protein
MSKRLLRRRWLVDLRISVIAGLATILVPTVFSLFPSWTGWTTSLKVAVLVAWFAAAAVVVAGAARQSTQVEDLVGTSLRRRDDARRAAGLRLLRALLRPEEAGFPPDHEFRLFVPTEDRAVLLPEYASPGSTPSEGWKPGQGATGTAWSRNAYIRVFGAAVSDGTYRLTPEQQRRYRDLSAVASMPVQNARGDPIAVLSVSTQGDETFLASDEAAQKLFELASIVARVLIDIFRVAHD